MSNLSLKIRILDKEYQVNCEPNERKRLSIPQKLLNEKMEEIRRGSHIIGLERIAVMAALNLAHDLIRSNQAAEKNSAANRCLAINELKTRFCACRSL